MGLRSRRGKVKRSHPQRWRSWNAGSELAHTLERMSREAGQLPEVRHGFASLAQAHRQSMASLLEYDRLQEEALRSLMNKPERAHGRGASRSVVQAGSGPSQAPPIQAGIRREALGPRAGDPVQGRSTSHHTSICQDRWFLPDSEGIRSGAKPDEVTGTPSVATPGDHAVLGSISSSTQRAIAQQPGKCRRDDHGGSDPSRELQLPLAPRECKVLSRIQCGAF